MSNVTRRLLSQASFPDNAIAWMRDLVPKALTTTNNTLQRRSSSSTSIMESSAIATPPVQFAVEAEDLAEELLVAREENDFLRCNYFSIEARAKEDAARHQLEMAKLQEELVRQRDDNGLIRDEFASIRIENTELVKQIRSLKKSEFELLQDLEDARKLAGDKAVLRDRMIEAERKFAEAALKLEQSNEVLKQATELTDRRAQDEIMIMTLKREKATIQEKLDDMLRKQDMHLAQLKIMRQTLADSKITVELLSAKSTTCQMHHEAENKKMTGMVFALQKVIGRLHERMLDYMDHSNEREDAAKFFDNMEASDTSDAIGAVEERPRSASSLPITCQRQREMTSQRPPKGHRCAKCPFKDAFAEYSTLFGSLIDHYGIKALKLQNSWTA